MITANELRQKYLDFFKAKGHVIVPSDSLVPENDPSTLFTGSGMQPMVTYLLGEPHPEGTRIANSQKCFRTVEFEEVGDNRHLTYFEMLGNWSLGDYFKKEQIPWIFEFVTQEIGLDPDKLYVTVYRGNKKFDLPKDTEAAKLWQQVFKEVGIGAKDIDMAEQDGMQGGRIFYYQDEKNWWSRVLPIENMPVGEPGGPDSEMFYDFGEELKIHENSKYKNQVCHVNCDCGRFLEIGNNVFMMYLREKSGFEDLPNKNIDFGGGLERFTMAAQGQQDIFRIDLFDPIRTIVEEVSDKTYGENKEETFAFRVIMDHLRAATQLISDEVLPSNKDRGYYVRRLIRRSVRFAHKLGVKDNFGARVARAVVETYSEAYPIMKDRQADIEREMDQEESKFRRTLEKGLKEFKKVREKSKGHFISGADAFDLYQTYGFPIEMILEIAQEEGVKVDVKGFEEAHEIERQKHTEVSRAGAEEKFRGGLADHSEQTTKLHTANHLLQAALRKVLGEHVAQKGSNITKDRLRFDFTQPRKLTTQEIKQTEDLVNQAIERNYPVSWQEMTVAEAKKKGALGFFEERYADMVKVYTVGDPETPPTGDPNSPTFSKEICGGPHVEHTGVIGHFKITKEEAVSAGVRRIKAIVE